MLEIDTVLQERYQIVRSLGQGGMGAVYEAIDTRLDKTVAVKEVLLELEDSSDEYQKKLIKKAFRREANSLVKAKHQSVPDVTDYFSEQNCLFLVMEFVEGDDLARILKKRGKPFLLEEALPWIDQLLKALDYLHNLTPPIIHRDIKPQNLKLNEWQKIKLLDFGIAKSTDKNSTLTQHTFIGATLNYSPIEQVLRVISPTFREFILLQHKDNVEKILDQDTDEHCDIFALGATVYHLLTNKAPLDITKRALEIWEGREDPLVEASDINPDIPKSVSLWLSKALAFELKDRFSSAGEMREDLQEAIAENGIKPYRKYQKQSQKEDTGKDYEKILTQAKTEQLIKPIEPDEKKSVSSLTDLFSRMEESNANSSEENSSDEFTLTDYEMPDADIPEDDFSNDLTEYSYLDEELLNEHDEDEPEPTNIRFSTHPKVKIIEPASSNRKYIMSLPIIGILFLVIFGGGFFGFVTWINSSDTPVEQKSAIENTNIDPAETPDLILSVETNSDSDVNTATNLNTANVEEPKSNTINSEEPKSNKTVKTVKQTEKPTVKPTKVPTATPKPQPKVTPKPTRKPKPRAKPKPTKDPRCVYTDSCK